MYNNKKYLLLFIFCILGFLSKINAKDSISVYIFLLDKCRICQELSPEVNSLYEEYKHEFNFIGVFPNFISKTNDIREFTDKYKIKFQTKTDYFKLLSNKLRATVTPEVIVFNENSEKILYRGAINDLFYSPGKRRHQILNHYLRDALDQISHGTIVSQPSTASIGCYINFNDFKDN